MSLNFAFFILVHCVSLSFFPRIREETGRRLCTIYFVLVRGLALSLSESLSTRQTTAKKPEVPYLPPWGVTWCETAYQAHRQAGLNALSNGVRSI